jgi:hypothetical protein
MTWQLAALVRWLVVPSAQRSNPVNQTTAATLMPLSKTPLVKCLIDPLDRRATLAMTATLVIASAAKQSSQSNNRRSRRGNQMPLSKALLVKCLF